MVGLLLLGPLIGCDSSTRDRWVEGMQPRSKIDEDGFPVFDCSMPPDEAVIFVMPATSAILAYSMTSFEVVTSDALASIPPLHGLLSHTSIGGDPGNLSYTASLLGPRLSFFGLAHPVEAQGEQISDPLNPYGTGVFYYFHGGVTWGAPWLDTGIVRMGSDSYYHPTRLCLSRIRHLRFAGVFTHWTDLENRIEVSDVEFPVSFVFDVQKSRIPEPATDIYKWGSVDHRYTTLADDQRDVRDLGSVTDYYADDSPPELVWSPDSLPADDE